MIFVGCDVGQVHTGLSILSEDDKCLFSTDFSRELSEEEFGKDVADFIKNNAQLSLFDKYLKSFSEPIGMIVFEGPNYGCSNVTQISIGSIHGAYWQYCMFREINFAVVTPKSVNYSVFGTAKDINKRDTINAMKKRYPEAGIRDSNMADSLAMASLARKFWYSIYSEIDLTEGEREVLLSKKLYKGKPKGLFYQQREKYMIFEGRS